MSALSAKPSRLGAAIPSRFALVGLLALAGACSPIARPATFHGATEAVTEASLGGPFDGQIVDAKTGEPLQEAIVVGVWSFDKGDGFTGPVGSQTVEVITDAAGRYRIPAVRPPARLRQKSSRLVSFCLFVYKRGYAAYRSDELFGGGARRDFTSRHNRVELEKWREKDSHADHVLFLAAPREIARVASWEHLPANVDLYRRLGGSQVEADEDARPPTPTPGPDTAPREQTLLDVSALLTPEDAKTRTGHEGELEVVELTDLARTYFYQGIHLRSVDGGEENDIAYRVWLEPAGGMDPVIETLRATLPGVEVSAEITAETWVYDGSDVRAIGFVDRSRSVGVLLTCGASQCPDIDTALILAKFIHGRIESDAIRRVRAGDRKQPLPPSTTAPRTPSTSSTGAADRAPTSETKATPEAADPPAEEDE